MFVKCFTCFGCSFRVEDSLLPSPNLPQDDWGWERAGFEPSTIDKSERQSSAQTARPGSHSNRRLLKPGAVPTKFSFSKSTPSRKKTNYELRQPLLPQDTTIEEKTRDVTVQTDEDFITDLLKRVNTLEPGNASLLEEVAQLKLCYDSLKLKGDKAFKSYTGFTCLQFDTIFNFLCMSSCLEDKILSDSQNQLLVTMIKLRHGLTNNVLSYLINVSQLFLGFLLDVFRYCVRNVEVSTYGLVLNRSRLSTFVNHSPACRVIIDTCEYFIQQPKNPKQQQRSFSTYKNHNTVKALIGITPSGGISFISDLYNGSISDKEITLRSGLIEKLEPGDCVLSDRGFTVLKDNFEAKGITLLTPHFLKNKSQFEVTERGENKKVSCHRCHVERAISRIKNFKILAVEIPYALLHIIDEIH